jgi:hypothetical protein
MSFEPAAHAVAIHAEQISWLRCSALRVPHDGGAGWHWLSTLQLSCSAGCDAQLAVFTEIAAMVAGKPGRWAMHT